MQALTREEGFCAAICAATELKGVNEKISSWRMSNGSVHGSSTCFVLLKHRIWGLVNP